MTPGARVAAACEILDRYLAGEPAEKALTNWARSHRFAGSKDRAAIRDHVFDVLRTRRSCAALGGGETGRRLMIGLLRRSGQEPKTVFTGDGYAPAPLSGQEAEGPAELTLSERLDCPEWLFPALQAAFNTSVEAVLARQQQRAELFLRVNVRRCSVPQAIAQLAAEGVTVEPHGLSVTALRVVDGARLVQHGACYTEGLVEVQDVASQAVCDVITVPQGGRVLDYCAGGGGKTLALAARSEATFFAHDANPARMRDIPARAARAGVAVTVLAPSAAQGSALFDLVIADVPCSGSGTWARHPEAKWALTPQALDDLCKTQAAILDQTAALCAQAGHLAYMTCSILPCENEDQAAAFLRRWPDWRSVAQRHFSPLAGGDGLFIAIFTRLGCKGGV